MLSRSQPACTHSLGNTQPVKVAVTPMRQPQSNFPLPVTRRAAEFSTRRSQSVVDFGNPTSAELQQSTRDMSKEACTSDFVDSVSSDCFGRHCTIVILISVNNPLEPNVSMSWKFVGLDFYPRDAMLARVIAIATCLSVCPSVMRRYCVKTKKASVMISSPPGSPKTLVF